MKVNLLRENLNESWACSLFHDRNISIISLVRQKFCAKDLVEGRSSGNFFEIIIVNMIAGWVTRWTLHL